MNEVVVVDHYVLLRFTVFSSIIFSCLTCVVVWSQHKNINSRWRILQKLSRPNSFDLIEYSHLNLESVIMPTVWLPSSMSYFQIRYFTISRYPANTRLSPNVGTMLVHRLRRWSNIVPTLGERLVLAGYKLSLMFWPWLSATQSTSLVLFYKKRGSWEMLHDNLIWRT